MRWLLLLFVYTASAYKCSVVFQNKVTRESDRYDGFVVESLDPSIRDTLGCSANAVIVDVSNGAYSYDIEPYYDIASASYEAMSHICCADLERAADELNIDLIEVHFTTIEMGAYAYEVCDASRLNRCASIMDFVNVIRVEYNVELPRVNTTA